MKKELKDMTLKELWELFPIVLVPHNPLWKEWAEDEITHLTTDLSHFYPSISHIGSTAIEGIKAKPIIDILVEISPKSDWNKLRGILESSGYIRMSATESRMSFNKGYTTEGYADRVFHVHVHTAGDNDEIFFRNYLRANPEVAKEYENLKLSLLPKFKHNRDGYTEAKTEFIENIISQRKSIEEQLSSYASDIHNRLQSIDYPKYYH